jgi:hypothetical protein
VQHDRTKHVEVDRFFIKEKLDNKVIEVPPIGTDDQVADILTKAVSSNKFSRFLDKLGMCDIYAPTWGGMLTCIRIPTICGIPTIFGLLV